MMRDERHEMLNARKLRYKKLESQAGMIDAQRYTLNAKRKTLSVC
jgi:hypothetical protein